MDDTPPAGSDRGLFLAAGFGAERDGTDFFAMRILRVGWWDRFLQASAVLRLQGTFIDRGRLAKIIEHR